MILCLEKRSSFSLENRRWEINEQSSWLKHPAPATGAKIPLHSDCLCLFYQVSCWRRESLFTLRATFQILSKVTFQIRSEQINIWLHIWRELLNPRWPSHILARFDLYHKTQPLLHISVSFLKANGTNKFKIWCNKNQRVGWTYINFPNQIFWEMKCFTLYKIILQYFLNIFYSDINNNWPCHWRWSAQQY